MNHTQEMKMSEATNIGEFIQGFIEENEITQVELGRQLGVTKQYMHRLTRGEFERPMSVLSKLARQLKAEEKQKLVLLLAQSLMEELSRGGK